jgi:hypothetical protein
MNSAEALLVSPKDASVFPIEWTWDSELHRNIGHVETQIVLENVTDDRVEGYIAEDINGTRLFTYNDEQVVMVRYVYDGGFRSGWNIESKLYQGFFSIQFPEELRGRIDLVYIFIGQNQFTIDDATSSSSQSWVFTNSAKYVYQIGTPVGNKNNKITSSSTTASDDDYEEYSEEGDYGNQTQSQPNEVPAITKTYLKVMKAIMKIVAEDSDARLLDWGLEDAHDFYTSNNTTTSPIANQSAEANTTPIISDIPNIQIEGNAGYGAYVYYPPISAHDMEQGNLTSSVVCNIPSGSFFTLGITTTVVCQVTDAGGLTAIDTFDVTVVDTDSPRFWTVSTSVVTTEADSIGGAHLFYDLPTAFDIVDLGPSVSCDREPGSFFALGGSEVTCVATDDSGNNVYTSIRIMVVDTKPPQIVDVPSDMSYVALDNDGAVVFFSVSASDSVDAYPTVHCVTNSGFPVESGARLPLGLAHVTCTALDDSNNESDPISFDISVTLPNGKYQ